MPRILPNAHRYATKYRTADSVTENNPSAIKPSKQLITENGGQGMAKTDADHLHDLEFHLYGRWGVAQSFVSRIQSRLQTAESLQDCQAIIASKLWLINIICSE